MDSLFEYAVLLQPTKEEREAGNRARLLISPTVIIAANISEAHGAVWRDCSSMSDEQKLRLTIYVRHFTNENGVKL